MLRYLLASLFFVSLTATAYGLENSEGLPEIQQQEPQEMGAPADVSDDELEKFAKINLKAQEQEIEPQVDPQGFQSLVEDHDLRLEEFQQINMAVQQDPELQEELQEIFAELERDRR